MSWRFFFCIIRISILRHWLTIIMIEIITTIVVSFSVAEKRSKKLGYIFFLLRMPSWLMEASWLVMVERGGAQGHSLGGWEGGGGVVQSRTSAPTSGIHTSSICLSSLGIPVQVCLSFVTLGAPCWLTLGINEVQRFFFSNFFFFFFAFLKTTAPD